MTRVPEKLEKIYGGERYRYTHPFQKDPGGPTVYPSSTGHPYSLDIHTGMVWLHGQAYSIDRGCEGGVHHRVLGLGLSGPLVSPIGE